MPVMLGARLVEQRHRRIEFVLQLRAFAGVMRAGLLQLTDFRAQTFDRLLAFLHGAAQFIRGRFVFGKCVRVPGL